MEQEIILYNKEKVQVGIITLGEQAQRLDMNWMQKSSSESALELSSMLEKICNDKAVPSLCQRTVSTADGQAVNAEMLLNISVDDSKFMAALADYINHHNSRKHCVFAVLHRSTSQNGE